MEDLIDNIKAAEEDIKDAANAPIDEPSADEAHDSVDKQRMELII